LSWGRTPNAKKREVSLPLRLGGERSDLSGDAKKGAVGRFSREGGEARKRIMQQGSQKKGKNDNLFRGGKGKKKDLIL